MTKPAEAGDDATLDLFEGPRRLADPAARKRAAVEMIARHERALRNTARRYSLCGDDADDAYQRTLEIVLMKAPTDNPRELIRWTHTVMKHEALAVRRNRERLLGPASTPYGDDEETDWITLIPAQEDGPDLRVERREQIARSREALQALKPAELRALTLLAEGYSYAEISEMTGFSPTKVNRCLAEGRESFRRIVSRGEDGSRCEEMGLLLSAYCDGETPPRDAALVREHLRACASCRAAIREYRAAPRTVAALAPILPLSHSLLDRLRDAISHLHARLAGRGSGGGHLASAGTGGAPGVGLTGAVKIAAVCVAAGGAAAGGVAAGAIPVPFQGPDGQPAAAERITPPAAAPGSGSQEKRRHHSRNHASRRRKASERKAKASRNGSGRPETVAAPATEATPAPVEEAPAEATEPAAEYSPAPVAPSPPPSEPSSSSSDTGAGEFGP